MVAFLLMRAQLRDERDVMKYKISSTFHTDIRQRRTPTTFFPSGPRLASGVVAPLGESRPATLFAALLTPIEEAPILIDAAPLLDEPETSAAFDNSFWRSPARFSRSFLRCSILRISAINDWIVNKPRNFVNV